MKHLTITYNGTTLFDGNIEELVFTDNDTGVKVEGRLKATRATVGGAGLLDLLTAATRNKPTQEPNSE